MNRTVATTLIVVSFVVGVLAGTAVRATSAQQRVQPQVLVEGSAPDVFIPQTPAVGSTVWFGGIGGPDCTVVTVHKEWVKCDAHPTWRNIYTGAAYTVVAK